MRFLAAVLSLSALAPLAGCHSAYVSATIRNQTTTPITLVELDYPSASFGTQTLAPGQEFKYRFKILGSGEVKLLWTDAHNQEQHADGPHLDEGTEGSLAVLVTPLGVRWVPALQPK